MYEFYDKIKRPKYSPPAFVFFYVWVFLYVLMLISFIYLLFLPNYFLKFLGIGIFSLQIFLNFLWPYIFFKLKNIELSCVVCILLLVSVIMMTVIFFKISFVLGCLQIPYLLWLFFANVLNIEVYFMNKS